jgi:hypothetical protein
MRAMLDVDWNLALARLNFLHGYLRTMRKEVAVKNEKLLPDAADEARQAPASEQRQPWPARRRFWRRASHRPAPPKPQPAKPREPSEATAAARAAATES